MELLLNLDLQHGGNVDIKVKSTITVSINNTEFELSAQDAVQLHDELAKILNIRPIPINPFVGTRDAK